MKKIFILFALIFFPLFSTVVTIESTPDITPQEEVIRQVPENYKHVFFKTLFLILLGFGFIFILMLILKKFSSIRYKGLNDNSYIKVIERRPLSTKSILYLVQIGNQKVVIAESQLEMKKIIDLPNP